LRSIVAAAVIAMAAGTATAGGIERTPQSVAILFEPGNRAELTFGYVSPRVTGSVGGVGSGNAIRSHTQLGFAVKFALTERLDAALILDQPIGASTRYPSGTGYPLQGTIATIRSMALTGLLNYRLDGGLSVHGGVRALRTEGTARVTPVGDYRLEVEPDTALGYVLGVAWERPDIAARVSLTYNSRIRHSFEGRDGFGALTQDTSFRTTIPESVNLEFQTGVAPDTLAFGSIRWVRWKQFDIAPPAYVAIADEPIAFYESNTVTYTLGVGRRFDENWSGAVTLVHEPRTRDRMGNLGPVDGRTGAGLGLTWTDGAVSVTGGVQYFRIGDTTTRNVNGQFRNNSAWAAGLRVGFGF
jgi:long-chain fatty acid transport protein